MPASTQNLQAERAVIGACLLSSDALGTVSETLKPEDFQDVNNKAVYEICLSMYLENKPIDLITFQAEATSRGIFERIGGQPFLAELVSDDMLPSNAGYLRSDSAGSGVAQAHSRRRAEDSGTRGEGRR